MVRDLVTVTPLGLYCPQADAYIDPWRPVPTALITHAHADHARSGSSLYIAERTTADLLNLRLGSCTTNPVEYGSVIERNGVRISFHPAGHVPGSAQIALDNGVQKWVITGDFKREDDGISAPFQVVPCTHFVTESTFGLPIYRWEPQSVVLEQIVRWWTSNIADGKRSVIGAYSLGKAQRVIGMLAQRRELPGPLLAHPIIDDTNQVISKSIPALRERLKVAERLSIDSQKIPATALIVVPPQLLTSPWIHRLSPARTATVSGWMAVRGIRRRRNLGAGFVLSDHADFPALVATAQQSTARHIFVTHGSTHEFARYLTEECRVSARPLATQFGDPEMDEASNHEGSQPAGERS